MRERGITIDQLDAVRSAAQPSRESVLRQPDQLSVDEVHAYRKLSEELVADKGVINGIAEYGRVLMEEARLKPVAVYEIQARRITEAAVLLPEGSTSRFDYETAAQFYHTLAQDEELDRQRKLYGGSLAKKDSTPPGQKTRLSKEPPFPFGGGGRPQRLHGRRVLTLRMR